MGATFTDLIRAVLLRARDLALTEETERRAIRPGHLLLALLEDPESTATRLLGEHCDVVALRHHLASRLTGPRESRWWEASEVPYTPESKRALTLAQQAADGEFERHVRTVDLLRGLLCLEEAAWEADPALGGAQQAGINLLDLRTRVLAAAANR
jgi:ATP-dependent Clp protease ATP-binding subunit ClpA